MPICLAEVAISLATRMSSICARVNTCRCFQRRIGSATASGSAPSRNLHQHGVDVVVAGLRRLHRLQQARHAGAVQRRVGRGAGAVVDDGVVVLQELRLLRVLERDEHHRVAARRHHAPGQPDHGVVVAADAQRVAELEAGLHVGHRLVVVARDVAARHQETRLAGLAGLEAHHHGAHVGVALAHLHGEVGDVGGARHALHAAHARGRCRRAGWTTRRRGLACLSAPPTGRRRCCSAARAHRRPCRGRCRPSTASRRSAGPGRSR